MVSYNVLKYFKQNYEQFFLAKTYDDIVDEFTFMNEYPHTYQSDFSQYDSTNNFFLRTCVDERFFSLLLQDKLVHLKGISDETDAYFLSNVNAKFDIDCRGMRGRGEIFGTTYSGHPTATTLMGTFRNYLYHCFTFFRHP